MKKKMFKLLPIAAALALFALPQSANAAYLESDHPDQDRPAEPPDEAPPLPSPAPPPPAAVRPIPFPWPQPTDAPETLIALLRRLRVEPAIRFKDITVFPLASKEPEPIVDIETLDQALRAGLLTIYEKDDACVPEILGRNRSRWHVLLMAGEILAGGRQNRMLSADILLPPHSDQIPLPVYCAEKERWSGEKEFREAGLLAHPSLRGLALAGQPQDQIWREIDGSAGISAEAASPTRDYRRIYEAPPVRGRLDEYAKNLRMPRREIIGLAAACGEVVLGCDIFCDSKLLSAQWDKLIRSYCLGALERPAKGARGASTKAIEAMLENAIYAEYRHMATAGAGTLLRLTGRTSGTALVLNRRVVHAHLAIAGAVREKPHVLQPEEP